MGLLSFIKALITVINYSSVICFVASAILLLWNRQMKIHLLGCLYSINVCFSFISLLLHPLKNRIASRFLTWPEGVNMSFNSGRLSLLARGLFDPDRPIGVDRGWVSA